MVMAATAGPGGASPRHGGVGPVTSGGAAPGGATCRGFAARPGRTESANNLSPNRLALRVRELQTPRATPNPEGFVVAEIKIRNPVGSEFSLTSAEELAEVIQGGGITAAWEVWHATAKRWLPISNHPVFLSHGTDDA